MIIDTDAARNWIKQKVLNPEVPINNQNILKLTGINDIMIYANTLEEYEIALLKMSGRNRVETGKRTDANPFGS